MNSHQECERNPSKVQYGIANPKEAGSFDAQEALESDVESVPSVSSEKLEVFNAEEEDEDSEILEK